VIIDEVSSQLHFDIGYIIILSTIQEYISLFKRIFRTGGLYYNTPFIPELKLMGFLGWISVTYFL